MLVVQSQATTPIFFVKHLSTNAIRLLTFELSICVGSIVVIGILDLREPFGLACSELVELLTTKPQSTDESYKFYKIERRKSNAHSKTRHQAERSRRSMFQ